MLISLTAWPGAKSFCAGCAGEAGVGGERVVGGDPRAKDPAARDGGPGKAERHARPGADPVADAAAKSAERRGGPATKPPPTPPRGQEEAKKKLAEISKQAG